MAKHSNSINCPIQRFPRCSRYSTQWLSNQWLSYQSDLYFEPGTCWFSHWWKWQKRQLFFYFFICIITTWPPTYLRSLTWWCITILLFIYSFFFFNDGLTTERQLASGEIVSIDATAMSADAHVFQKYHWELGWSAHVGLSERIDTIWSRTELYWTELFIKKLELLAPTLPVCYSLLRMLLYSSTFSKRNVLHRCQNRFWIFVFLVPWFARPVLSVKGSASLLTQPFNSDVSKLEIKTFFFF